MFTNLFEISNSQFDFEVIYILYKIQGSSSPICST